jgi:CheY-like chemotaxis protein
MATTPVRQLRALVLEADSNALWDLQRSLEALRFAVLSAGDGASGLGLLLDELLDLDALVIAADLPHRDARSFAHLIRRAGGERDLAIVVLAENPTPHLRAELLALGVDVVLDRGDGAPAAADAVLEVVRARTPWSGAAASASSPTPAAALDSVERWTLSIGGLPLLRLPA